MSILHPSWSPLEGLLFQEPLHTFNNTVLPNIKYYPSRENIFRVFQKPVSDIKVVILGQDPYHSPNTAIGRAFAVNESAPIPPSLRIIRSELEYCYPTKVESFQTPDWRTLQHWEDQGVMLLNTALTVEAGEAGSHLDYWKAFTKAAILYLSAQQPCIWVLWGEKAKYYKNFILDDKVLTAESFTPENINHLPIGGDYNFILEAAHPVSEVYGGRGFSGQEHFRKINEILRVKKQKQIIW